MLHKNEGFAGEAESDPRRVPCRIQRALRV